MCRGAGKRHTFGASLKKLASTQIIGEFNRCEFKSTKKWNLITSNIMSHTTMSGIYVD